MSSVQRVWRSGWVQALVAIVALVLAATLFWWQGPEWGSVFDAFRFVIWTLGKGIGVVTARLRGCCGFPDSCVRIATAAKTALTISLAGQGGCLGKEPTVEA